MERTLRQPGYPTFHLMTCGISCALLAAFFWLIDVRGCSRWAFLLIVLGVNSITIDVASFLIDLEAIAGVFGGGLDLGRSQAVVTATVAGLVKWLFVYYLYRQRVFLKI